VPNILSRKLEIPFFFQKSDFFNTIKEYLISFTSQNMVKNDWQKHARFNTQVANPIQPFVICH